MKKEEKHYYWTAAHHPHTPVDFVVVPSLLLDSDEEFRRIPGLVHKEERHLFTTLMLQNPHARVFYFSSYLIDPVVVQYYLSLIPSEHIQCFTQKEVALPYTGEQATVNEIVPGRFYNVCMHDMEELALADKINKKYDHIVESVRELLQKRECKSDAYLLCYRTSHVEEKLANDLGLLMYASAPNLDMWGSKSGSRKIFEEAGIPLSPGTPLTHDKRELASHIRDLIKSENGSINKIVIKLDNFSAGGGNAILDLTPILKENGLPTVDEVEQHLDNLKPPYKDQTPEDFYRFIKSIGAIAESWVEGEELLSPSVQGIVAPSGKVCIISTHGQVLDGHEYTGCTFPAMPEHRDILTRYGQKVGKILSKKGVRGHFGVDFVERKSNQGNWETKAIEINLRCTGTTGPYLAMCALVPGEYNLQEGDYTAKDGMKKYYVGTDGLKEENLRGLKPGDMLDLVNKNKLLRWDPDTQTGCLFHMLGAMYAFGKVGATCVANSPEKAEEMMHQVKEFLAQIK